MLLSRVADSLYWIGRYLERAEQTARLIDVPPTTLTWWLDGAVRQGKRYDPVLREEAMVGSLVTWAEFVEARLLREYRKAGRLVLDDGGW